MTTEETLDKIIKAVTCNGMRELEEERCRQIAEEYALAKVNRARKEERDKHKEIVTVLRNVIATAFAMHGVLARGTKQTGRELSAASASFAKSLIEELNKENQ